MSTVLFFNGALYADTKVTETAITATAGYNVGDVIRTYERHKILHLKDNPCNVPVIIGCVGTLEGQEDFINWTKANRSAEENYTFCNSFSAFEYDGEVLSSWEVKPVRTVVRRLRNSYKLCKLYKFVLKKEYKYTIRDMAIGINMWGSLGSGGDFAVGHFNVEKHPVNAIKTAARYDSFTNTKIERVDLFSDKIAIVYDEDNEPKEKELKQLELEI